MSNASSENKPQAEKPHKHKKKSIKDLGSPIRVTTLTALIFFISQAAAFLIVNFALSWMQPGSVTVEHLMDSAKAQFFYVLLAEAIVIYLIFLFLKRQRLNFQAIGLGRAPQWSDAGRALVGFVAFFALIIAVNIILNALFPELKNQKQDVGFNNLNNSLDKLLAFVSLVILAPVGEEILVRGYLYSGLRRRLRFLPAMIITSLLFGLAHLQTGEGSAVLWAAGINTFVLSIVLVYLRERTGALYASILIHAINNFIAFGVHFRGILF